MKVIFDIPDDLKKDKDVNKIIDEANEMLGRIDKRITCRSE